MTKLILFILKSYRILCTKVKREGVKTSQYRASGLFRTPLLHKTRYGVFILSILTLFCLISLTTKSTYGSGLDLNDKTANGNNLTNHNSASDITSPLPSVTGDTDAVGFASTSSQYLTASDNTAWKPTSNISLEAWVYFSSLPGTGTYPALVSNISTTHGYGWEWFFDGDTGKIRFYVATVNGSFNAISSTSLSTGAWHHYAVTYDGSTVRFYVDGVADGTSSQTLALGYESGQNPAISSAYWGGFSRFITAYMDDIRIWNVVRSATEISNNKGSQLTGSESGLAAYYPMNTLASPTDTPTPTPTPGVVDGWNSAGETWTYASSTTITVPSDATTKYSPGDKIRLKQGGSYEYFYITGVTSTVLTVTGGSDYSVANATITDNYYSKADTPVGFPQWFNWTPTYSASGSMTYTSVTTDVAKFSITGRTVHIALQAQGTLGGTSSFGIRATAPVTPTNDGFYTDGGAYVDEVGNHEFSGGVYPNNGELEFGVFGNFVTGHSTVIGTSYSYEF